MQLLGSQNDMATIRLLCYSFRHSHSWALQRGLRYTFAAPTTLPYQACLFDTLPGLRSTALPRWIIGAAALDQ